MTAAGLTNEAVGTGVRAQRLAFGISQTELATAMREYGHKWSQQTVVAVEKGQRPLRYTEAVVLEELIWFAGESDPQVARDAAAYRRILRCIGENETAKLGESGDAKSIAKTLSVMTRVELVPAQAVAS